MADRTNTHTKSAYGGEGWTLRPTSLSEELGTLWAKCGINSEYAPLRAVLLHRPGAELAASADPRAVNMLDSLDIAKAQAEHDTLAQTYRNNGIHVHYVKPPEPATPNQMFMADVFVMTPEGAIVARPASRVRAGEERIAAQALANIGAPIVRSIGGRGTFEGADMMWLDPKTVILGRGLRTNDEGARQIATLLGELGISVVQVDLVFGSMHLMGMLRIVDKDLAIAWPGRFVHRGIEALKARGYRVEFLPNELEARNGFALNFVTIAPRKIIMCAGNDTTQKFYESLGIQCIPVKMDELGKAAGAIGCLSGIIEREMI